MRLNKYLAQTGVCSRRKADDYIFDGKVKVNGKVAFELGTVIDETKDIVEVNGEKIQPEEKKIYLAFNKPLGYISSAHTWQGASVLDLVKIPERVYPVGRLDKDSHGLLILTNDGDFTYELTHAKFGHDKEYQVTFGQALTPGDIRDFESGMMIDGQRIQPVEVKAVKGNQVNLILKEGINRQIRRMAGARGLSVIDLKRVRIGKLKLGILKPGEYKNIKPSDVV